MTMRNGNGNGHAEHYAGETPKRKGPDDPAHAGSFASEGQGVEFPGAEQVAHQPSRAPQQPALRMTRSRAKLEHLEPGEPLPATETTPTKRLPPPSASQVQPGGVEAHLGEHPKTAGGMLARWAWHKGKGADQAAMMAHLRGLDDEGLSAALETASTHLDPEAPHAGQVRKMLRKVLASRPSKLAPVALSQDNRDLAHVVDLSALDPGGQEDVLAVLNHFPQVKGAMQGYYLPLGLKIENVLGPDLPAVVRGVRESDLQGGNTSQRPSRQYARLADAKLSRDIFAYREADSAERCGTCAFYRGGDKDGDLGTCKLYEHLVGDQPDTWNLMSDVGPHMTCSAWVGKSGQEWAKVDKKAGNGQAQHYEDQEGPKPPKVEAVAASKPPAAVKPPKAAGTPSAAPAAPVPKPVKPAEVATAKPTQMAAPFSAAQDAPGTAEPAPAIQKPAQTWNWHQMTPQQQQEVFQVFTDSYTKATGKSWDQHTFTSRARGWEFHGVPPGQPGTGFVAVRRQQSGLIKLTGAAGSPFGIARGMRELVKQGGPIYGIMTDNFAPSMKKAGLIEPSPDLIRDVVKEVPFLASQIGNVSDTGALEVEVAGGLGKAQKHFFGSVEYFDWLKEHAPISDGLKQRIQGMLDEQAPVALMRLALAEFYEAVEAEVQAPKAPSAAPVKPPTAFKAPKAVGAVPMASAASHPLVPRPTKPVETLPAAIKPARMPHTAASALPPAGEIPGAENNQGFDPNTPIDPDSKTGIPEVKDQEEQKENQSTPEQHFEEYKRLGTKAPRFKAWFGDWEKDPKNASKVVDEKTGEPKETFEVKKVFHGRQAKFNQFDKARMGKKGIHSGVGFYFAENKDVAATYANQGEAKDSDILEAYLSIKNPFDFDSKVSSSDIDRWAAAMQQMNEYGFSEEKEQSFRNGAFGKSSGYGLWVTMARTIGMHKVNQVLAALGHDGLTHRAGDAYGSVKYSDKDFGRVWVAFEPHQIKSVANQGTFDPANPRMDLAKAGAGEHYEGEMEVQEPKAPAPATQVKSPSWMDKPSAQSKVMKPKITKILGWAPNKGKTQVQPAHTIPATMPKVEAALKAYQEKYAPKADFAGYVHTMSSFPHSEDFAQKLGVPLEDLKAYMAIQQDKAAAKNPQKGKSKEEKPAQAWKEKSPEQIDKDIDLPEDVSGKKLAEDLAKIKNPEDQKAYIEAWAKNASAPVEDFHHWIASKVPGYQPPAADKNAAKKNPAADVVPAKQMPYLGAAIAEKTAKMGVTDKDLAEKLISGEASIEGWADSLHVDVEDVQAWIKTQVPDYDPVKQVEKALDVYYAGSTEPWADTFAQKMIDKGWDKPQALSNWANHLKVPLASLKQYLASKVPGWKPPAKKDKEGATVGGSLQHVDKAMAKYLAESPDLTLDKLLEWTNHTASTDMVGKWAKGLGISEKDIHAWVKQKTEEKAKADQSVMLAKVDEAVAKQLTSEEHLLKPEDKATQEDIDKALAQKAKWLDAHGWGNLLTYAEEIGVAAKDLQSWANHKVKQQKEAELAAVTAKVKKAFADKFPGVDPKAFAGFHNAASHGIPGSLMHELGVTWKELQAYLDAEEAAGNKSPSAFALYMVNHPGAIKQWADIVGYDPEGLKAKLGGYVQEALAPVGEKLEAYAVEQNVDVSVEVAEMKLKLQNSSQYAEGFLDVWAEDFGVDPSDLKAYLDTYQYAKPKSIEEKIQKLVLKPPSSFPTMSAYVDYLNKASYGDIDLAAQQLKVPTPELQSWLAKHPSNKNRPRTREEVLQGWETRDANRPVPGTRAATEQNRQYMEQVMPRLEQMVSHAIGEGIEVEGAVRAWDDVSSEDKESVEEKWKEYHYDDYYDLELESWRDNLGSDIDYQLREDVEWYDQTLLKWADENNLDMGSEEGYPDALMWKNDKYKGIDPGHIVFPEEAESDETWDLEKKEAAWRDLESDWERYLAKAFDRETESRYKAEIDNPPDSISSSTNERLDEAWGELDDDDKFEFGQKKKLIDDSSTQELEAPDEYKPFKDGLDYAKTRAIVLHLQEQRSREMLAERGLPEKADLAGLAAQVWSSWKASSTSEVGLALQVATAAELNGHLRLTQEQETESLDGYVAIARAAKVVSGDVDEDTRRGYELAKLHVRATWEASQYVLRKAGLEDVVLYRGLMLTEKMVEEEGEQEAVEIGGGEVDVPTGKIHHPGKKYRSLPGLKLLRNGAASTTSDRKTANGWNGIDADRSATARVVIRIHAPIESVVSIPVFGQNVHEEQESVTAGLQWHAWDAWLKEAPDHEEVPVRKGKS